MIEYENSILPKLLAKENISIRHGKYHTAWFDIKNRVLGLPLWKDMGKDVYDLLIGHEVGHALETPFEGWHDSPEKLEGCPRSYINVVEDARIERKVMNRYPGLISSFKKGYNVLYQNEFFGDTANLDFDEVKLIDKINLKTKLRDLIDVPFNSEEEALYNRALTTESFEDVLNLVRDILAYTKENTPELIQKPEPPVDLDDSDDNNEENDGPNQGGHDDGEQEEDQEQETQSSSTPSEVEESEQSQDDKEKIRSAGQEDEDVSVTDETYRAKEDTLKVGEDVKMFNSLSKELRDQCVIPYERLKEDRIQAREWVTKEAGWYTENQDNYEYIPEGFADHLEWWDAEYKNYMTKTKKSVNFAIKEFEQRKAATRWQKATVAKTGKLDINKLWAYKTSEDIFLQSTKLADAKNHGMMMLIDFSGSMSSDMKYVMDQLLHTVIFCKAVNIPFEVYGFTSTNKLRQFDNEGLSDDDINMKRGDMDMDNLSMPLLVSSDMNKTQYEDATRHLYYRTRDDFWFLRAPLAKLEDYGSTPLDQALVVSHYLIKDFKRRNRIEKMTFITFTDGDANSVRAIGDRTYNPKETKFQIDKKVVTAKEGRNYNDWRSLYTKTLLGNIKKRYNVNTIGFFMAGNSGDWSNRVWRLAEELRVYADDEFKKELGKEFRKNKCVERSSVFGYDTYYMVKGGKTLKATADEFDVDDDATNRQISSAFRKAAKSGKSSKVLMTKFGAAVA